MTEKRLVAIATFTIHFPRTADVFGFLALAAFTGLFKVPAQLHLAENTFTLHFLFQNPQGLIDIIVAYGYRYQLVITSFRFLFQH